MNNEVQGDFMSDTMVFNWTDGSNQEFQEFYRKTEEYYSKIVGGILQTRAIMADAVGLYEKLGYSKIENYPPYDNLVGAVCMAKNL